MHVVRFFTEAQWISPTYISIPQLGLENVEHPESWTRNEAKTKCARGKFYRSVSSGKDIQAAQQCRSSCDYCKHTII